MPSSRPLITVPTTLPRCATGDRVAANGTSTWATTENAPVMAVPASSIGSERALALISNPTMASNIMITINRRRSTRSPSGTSRISPTA